MDFTHSIFDKQAIVNFLIAEHEATTAKRMSPETSIYQKRVALAQGALLERLINLFDVENAERDPQEADAA
jgi:hypothetical protein